ncbi:[protein release factor]-glutamine N5-methyltransferase [Trinickia symbiotica]|uniref:Release factor glutamine methyltransferase n=1 Tax=Trinickia symbiotica TaxID=863227 RepID=A0A2N7WZ26_9BURK|nr:peptide chain release factor N(5)-glutamine methyltransferase [Trinickia symbiotica]PMS34753.1 peptide chain release factor N(5)-glutamine methyltransferase [Trinickia symbiotica]PPK43272.1 [protein release factor]-glutamine N5-methyltransferase [Trinickia symbiotica]
MPASPPPSRTATDLLRASPLAALEARILLAHALGWRRTELITRGDEPLDEAQVAVYRSLEARRAAGEPIAQIVGAREFYGLEFEVTPHVLIPRPETELLVETALAAIAPLTRPRVLDLGTGSGAIAIAIASARPDARVWALDRSPEALAVATRNAVRLVGERRPGGAIELLQSDWYAALDPALSFDVIVSNPPYIASGDPHLGVGDLRFEPRGALTDEADGLSAIRAIVVGAGAFMAPGGQLWLEHGYDQAAAVRALIAAQGFADVRSLGDLAGIERASGGIAPGAVDGEMATA